VEREILVADDFGTDESARAEFPDAAELVVYNPR
jgi:hypothetical protein